MTEEIPVLDELLDNEALKDTLSSDEEFEELVHDSRNSDLKVLGWEREGSKFLVFEYSGTTYLRLQKNQDIHHYHIRDRFIGELRSAGFEPEGLSDKGGGDVKASRKDKATILQFYGESSVFGKYDTNLLKGILDTNLDKKISYELQ